MKLFKYIFILFGTLFILNNAAAKDLKIAFFASSSENGYNQAIWEGVKAAATRARKALGELGKLAKSRRAEIQDKKNNL